MENKFLPLLKPIKIGSMELKNRIVFPPMTTMFNDTRGNFTDRSIDYYAERAKGGASMIITDACFPFDGNIDGSVTFRFTGDESLTKLNLIVEAVHAYGAKFCLQLSGGQGRVGGLVNGKPQKSASKVNWLYNPTMTCEEMSVDEIKKSIKDIVEIAVKGKSVGVDAVDIHAHNGYLLDQFMSPQWNMRTDEYGGSMENRMRFPLELIAALKEALGKDYPVIYRISIDQCLPNGRKIDDTIPMLKLLVDAGVDALDVDSGVYESMDYMFPPYYLGDTPYLYVAKAIREAGITIPILNSGSYTPEKALEAVESGYVDCVMFGRPMIAEPNIVNKLITNTPEDILPCIRCNDFCLKGVMTRKGLSCAVNACAGNEVRNKITKVEEPKKIVVVGGGPGGMEAARVAKLKGHDVVLYEKSDKLGGMITAAATPKFKSQLKKLIDWQEIQLNKLNVTVILNKEINAHSPELQSADQIIVAAGSIEIVPPISGIELDNVVGIVNAHEKPDLVKGNNLIICGGGLSGCDYALEQAIDGKKVTIVEMLPTIAKDMISVNTISLKTMLAKNNVEILTSHTVKEILTDGVRVEYEGEIKTINCDTVITAFGQKSNSVVPIAIRDKYPLNTRIIGDSLKIGKVGDAIRDGFFAANTIN